MSSATRIKDSFTCRHRGCRWARLACGSSTSRPCFPGSCPCKRFNSIATKLKIDFVPTWVQPPTRELGCQDPRSACPTKKLSKRWWWWWWWWWRRRRAQTQRKKNLLMSSTPVGEHTSSTSSTDHHLLVRIIGRLQDGNFLEETLPCRILWTPRPSWPCPFFRSWALPRSFSCWLTRKSLSSGLRNLSHGSLADPGQCYIVRRKKGKADI